jgi:hypothetical protein
VAGLRVGWDGTKKIIPWDNFFFVHPMVWDKFFLNHRMGWDGIKNFFRLMEWDGTKSFRPIPSHDLKKTSNRVLKTNSSDHYQFYQ